MKKAAFFWSGGKDSSMALYEVLRDQQFEVVCLITTINQHFGRVSMHGVREELLEQQAISIGIPLHKMYVPEISTNEAYEASLATLFEDLKSQGINTVIYGDIFLEDLKVYREQLLQKAGMKGVFPLWKRTTSELIQEFLSLGFKTITCCVSSSSLGKEWVGRIIDKDFISQLPITVDPCGENGEFHTFCFEGPIFQQILPIKVGEVIFKPITLDSSSDQGFWFVDILPA